MRFFKKWMKQLSRTTSKMRTRKATQGTHPKTDHKEAWLITKRRTSERFTVGCLMMGGTISQPSRQTQTGKVSRVTGTHLTFWHISTYLSYGILPYGISRYKGLDLPAFVTNLSAYLVVHTARPPAQAHSQSQ